MLFPICYEDCSGQLDIIIDQNTIERVFYILLTLEHLYVDIEKNFDGMTQKFQEVLNMYEDCTEMSVLTNSFEEINNEAINSMLEDLKSLMGVVEKNKKKKNILAAFEFSDKEIKFVYYVNISRTAGFFLLIFYFIFYICFFFFKRGK